MWYYTVKETTTTIIGEDDEGNVTYKTVITYSAYCPNDLLFFPDTRIDGEFEVEFSIDNRGVAIIDNGQCDDLLLSDKAISTAVADEIIRVSEAQVAGAMSGRTTAGIAREIRFHSTFGSLTGIRKIKTADIGGTDASRSDYDYNAKGFENIYRIPAVLLELLKQ